MSGTWKGQDLPAIGSKCIIFVNRVNSPEGWWIGRVTNRGTASIGHETVTAIIHGPIEHALDHEIILSHRTEPIENYDVYPYSQGLVRLVQGFLTEIKSVQNDLAECRIQRDELRRIIANAMNFDGT
ncbi:MAG: hypothetical protein WC911_01735 [Thermoleophilia bacterium]